MVLSKSDIHLTKKCCIRIASKQHLQIAFSLIYSLIRKLNILLIWYQLYKETINCQILVNKFSAVCSKSLSTMLDEFAFKF